jgi:hypothetical protein
MDDAQIDAMVEAAVVADGAQAPSPAR